MIRARIPEREPRPVIVINCRSAQRLLDACIGAICDHNELDPTDATVRQAIAADVAHRLAAPLGGGTIEGNPA